MSVLAQEELLFLAGIWHSQTGAVALEVPH